MNEEKRVYSPEERERYKGNRLRENIVWKFSSVTGQDA